MAPVLTLHQGDAQAEFVEHPTEVARQALYAAAEHGLSEWRLDGARLGDRRLHEADQYRRFADTLPRRAIRKED